MTTPLILAALLAGATGNLTLGTSTESDGRQVPFARIHWTAVPGGLHTFERTDDLAGDWQTILDHCEPGADEFELHDYTITESAARTYRLKTHAQICQPFVSNPENLQKPQQIREVLTGSSPAKRTNLLTVQISRKTNENGRFRAVISVFPDSQTASLFNKQNTAFLSADVSRDSSAEISGAGPGAVDCGSAVHAEGAAFLRDLSGGGEVRGQIPDRAAEVRGDTAGVIR